MSEGIYGGAIVATEGDRLAIAYRDGRPGVVLVAGRDVPRAQPLPDAPTRHSVTAELVGACVAEAVARLAGVEPVRVEVPHAFAPRPSPPRAPFTSAAGLACAAPLTSAERAYAASLHASWLARALVAALRARGVAVEAAPPSTSSAARRALAPIP